MLHGKMFLREEFMESDGGTVKKKERRKKKRKMSLKVGIPERGMELKGRKRSFKQNH